MNIALIMAAGSGSRMNLNIPKQFININDKPLIIHTINRFLNNYLIDKVVLVIKKSEEENFKRILFYEGMEKKVSLVYGGKTRQESVYLALLSLSKTTSDNDIILIHDGARPNISDDIIIDNIDSAKVYKSGITAYKSENTIIRRKDNAIELLKRDELFVVQTPQSFVFKDILNAHKYCHDNKILGLTDDSAVYIKYGKNISLVNGSKYNLKITTIDDVNLYKFYLKNKIE